MEQEILQVAVLVAGSVELLKHTPWLGKYFKKTLPFGSLPFGIIFGFVLFSGNGLYDTLIIGVGGTLLANGMYDQLSILMKAYYEKTFKNL